MSQMEETSLKTDNEVTQQYITWWLTHSIISSNHGNTAFLDLCCFFFFFDELTFFLACNPQRRNPFPSSRR